MPALFSTASQLDDPAGLWRGRACLNAVSKDLRGELVLLDRRRDKCEDPPCETLTTDHFLKLEVVSHERCDSKPARRLDGGFHVRRLVSKFLDGAAERRGMHTGEFEWHGSGMQVEGTMHGMTNVGTHRAPALDPCQECDSTGFMEGRLLGRVTEAKDRRLVGCHVTASYRFRFDPSEGFEDTGIEGTLEGLLVCGCGGKDCLDLGGFAEGNYPNPWTLNGHTFEVFDHTGAPTANARIVDLGGLIGLDVNYEMRVVLAAPASSLDITLAQFSSPATVAAVDGSGTTLDSATMTGASGPQTLHLTGPGIASLIVKAPGNETILLKLCPA